MKKTNYEGVLRACGQALKSKDKKVDLTCLWKYASNEKDIVNVVSFAKATIEEHFKGIKMQIEVTEQQDIFAYLEGELKTSGVEEWLRKKLVQRNKDIAFHNLQSFYKNEPRWLTQAKGFLAYIKTVLKRICEEMGQNFTFDVNKHKQKIYVKYVGDNSFIDSLIIKLFFSFYIDIFLGIRYIERRVYPVFATDE